LQVFAACGFVFARPLLDAFGRSPETFLDESTSRVAIVLFALICTFVPALVIFALTLVTRVFGEHVRTIVHHVTMGALIGIFVAQELTQAQTWPYVVIWLLAIVVAVLATVLIWRVRAAELFAMYVCIAPLLFFFIFVSSSQTADLLRDPKGATAPAATSNTPIVFLVLDELPTASLLDGRGNIDPTVFPGFARLAERATWYRNTTTVATATHKAVPAILTGRMPPEEDVSPTAASYPESLFTYLGTSYPMRVHEGVEAVCPERLCARAKGGGLPSALELARTVWTERFEHKKKRPVRFIDFGGDNNDDRAARLALFAGSVGQPGPHLDYMHSMEPHTPFEMLPSGRRYPFREFDGTGFTYSWVDDDAARVGRVAHLLQLQFVDSQITRLLDTLERSGRFDETLLVVTADHGIAFEGQKSLRGMNATNAVDIAWVPLFIKEPRQAAGTIDDRIARTIDIMPTIADIIDAPFPWRVDGQSLLGPPPASNERALSPVSLDERPLDDNGHIVLDGEAGFRELLARPAAVVGADELGVFRAGDYGALVGARTAELGNGPPFDGSYHLDEPPPVYDPNAPVAPVSFHATVKAPVGTTVALVVNDRVAGWYRLHGDQARFLVPESLLRPGPNTVSLVALEGPVDDATLRPLRPE
jgi:hypothetical protein